MLSAQPRPASPQAKFSGYGWELVQGLYASPALDIPRRERFPFVKRGAST